MAGWRRTLAAGLLTGATSLVLFGLAHMVLITPLVHGPDHPLWMRLGLMFVAPVGFGLVPAVIASLLVAVGWRLTRASGRLGPWRFGLVVASTLAAPAVASFLVRPGFDTEPSAAVMVPVFLGALAPALAVGAWAGGWRGALVFPAGLFPAAGVLTMFVMPELWRGNLWVVLFLASVVAILATSGLWMAHYEAFLERRARDREGVLARQPGSAPSSPEGTSS